MTKRYKVRSKKIEKTFAGLLGYYPNVAAHQIWERLVYNFSVQKHYRFDITHTDRQADTNFFIEVSESYGYKMCKKKVSAQLEEK